MTINLSFTNSSAIEMRDGLATNINGTYLTLGAEVIRDMGGNNPAVAIVSVYVWLLTTLQTLPDQTLNDEVLILV